MTDISHMFFMTNTAFHKYRTFIQHARSTVAAGNDTTFCRKALVVLTHEQSGVVD
jgi:hypothetical protein